MTREEAIKWFKENPFMHKDHEPFKMAIEALEKENDVIDCVLEIVDKDIDFYTQSYRDVVNAFKAFREEVLALKERDLQIREKSA